MVYSYNKESVFTQVLLKRAFFHKSRAFTGKKEGISLAMPTFIVFKMFLYISRRWNTCVGKGVVTKAASFNIRDVPLSADRKDGVTSNQIGVFQ
jgi:hypothetical protein